LIGVVVAPEPTGDADTAGGDDAAAEAALGNAANAAPPARTAVRHRPTCTGRKFGNLIDDLLCLSVSCESSAIYQASMIGT
jgi:hypothetical protein